MSQRWRRSASSAADSKQFSLQASYFEWTDATKTGTFLGALAEATGVAFDVSVVFNLQGLIAGWCKESRENGDSKDQTRIADWSHEEALMARNSHHGAHVLRTARLLVRIEDNQDSLHSQQNVISIFLNSRHPVQSISGTDCHLLPLKPSSPGERPFLYIDVEINWACFFVKGPSRPGIGILDWQISFSLAPSSALVSCVPSHSQLLVARRGRTYVCGMLSAEVPPVSGRQRGRAAGSVCALRPTVTPTCE